MRLFVALDLPDSVKEQLATLRGGVFGAKWRPLEKMHLTLRFIGEMDSHETDEIIREFRTIRFPAFHLTLAEIGYFAIGDMPHHLWTGVQNTKALIELQEKITDALKRTGVSMHDKYKFMPHVTLAKLQGTSMNEVFAYIAQNNLFKTEPFLVESFTLFSSHIRENGEGKFHTPEEEFPLSLI